MTSSDSQIVQQASQPDIPLSDLAQLAIKAVAETGALPVGAVLLEGPIADRLGMSRAPVRTALQRLEDAGVINRFNGRGYLYGDASAPVRVDLRAINWANAVNDVLSEPATLAPEKVVIELTQAIMAHIPFGRYRIRESALAAHFDVNRAVAREALFHLFKSGLVEKNARSHWIAGPLTAEMTRAQFALRTILEPAALTLAAPFIPRASIDAGLEFAQTLMDRGDPLGGAQIERLDIDLHQTCLAQCPNVRILETIRQNQMPDTANRLFFERLPHRTGTTIIAEHCTVLNALAAGDTDGATEALRSHLENASERTVKRLKILSILPEPQISPLLTPTGRA